MMVTKEIRRKHQLRVLAQSLGGNSMTDVMNKIIELLDCCAERRARSMPNDIGELIILAQHPSPTVRRIIAENPLTPRIVLHLLCRDKDAEVRLSAAENPNTPASSLAALLTDESSDLRYALAENHNLPLSITNSLCNDENPYVAYRASKTMNRRSRSCKVYETSGAYATAQHVAS
jgi:hypothetical protein